MKTSPEDITVLLVGGGSIIAPDELEGVKEIIRPPFFGVANAVGAAMAKGAPLLSDDEGARRHGLTGSVAVAPASCRGGRHDRAARGARRSRWRPSEESLIKPEPDVRFRLGD